MTLMSDNFSNILHLYTARNILKYALKNTFCIRRKAFSLKLEDWTVKDFQTLCTWSEILAGQDCWWSQFPGVTKLYFRETGRPTPSMVASLPTAQQ